MSKNTMLNRAGILLIVLAKMIITLVLSYGLAGTTSWLLKGVSRKPLRWLLAILLEPLLKRGLGALSGRFVKEKHETVAK